MVHREGVVVVMEVDSDRGRLGIEVTCGTGVSAIAALKPGLQAAEPPRTLCGP